MEDSQESILTCSIASMSYTIRDFRRLRICIVYSVPHSTKDWEAKNW